MAGFNFANLSANFFTSPLIGTNILSDGVNPTEILNFLFKKSFGIANSKPYWDYSDETVGFNSTPFTNLNSLYSQKIPTINELIPLIKIDSWVNPNGGGGEKWISSNFPYISYYSSIVMNPCLQNQFSNTFFCGTKYFDSLNNRAYSNFSTNAIPNNYGDGISFNHLVYSFNETRLFSENNGTGGSWILDTDSGILTFYDVVRIPGIRVDVNNPPRITYWRYEGLTGNANIVEVFDA